jgi:hypothetical protein
MTKSSLFKFFYKDSQLFDDSISGHILHKIVDQGGGFVLLGKDAQLSFIFVI